MSAPAPDSASNFADQRGCIALIGDVHSAWSYEDVRYFNDSAYACIVVMGDLGGSQARDGLSVARSMAALSRPTLVMPGNNDVDEYARIAAELTYRRGRLALLGDSDAPEGTVVPEVRSCGYSLHLVKLGALDVTLIAGRPFSRGGPEITFPDALERSFNVRTFEQSRACLCDLVDRAPTDQLIFFGHNGPAGLGSEPADPWGRDFDPDGGDWGDRDLRDAIDYACSRGKQPRAVVAGHMHWRLRAGGQRRWKVEQDGILYVNASRVPRIFRDKGQKLRQHVALKLTADQIQADEVLVADSSED